jgi:flagellar protein FlgJ
MQVSSSGGSGFYPAHSPLDKPTDATLASQVSNGEQLQSLGERPEKGEGSELKEKFQDFVGQTFFAEMIKSLRTSQKGAAYFNGGRAEEIFQGQFDQMMSEHLSDASAKSIADPMFELFQLGRSR